MSFENIENKKSSMKKIVSLESGHEHYEADAWTLTCIDDRFTEAVDATKEAAGWDRVDSVKWAGAAKELAKSDLSDLSGEAKSLLKQIATSIKLHNTKEIVLSVHETCGAYGDAMPHDHNEALSFMEGELAKAGKVVAHYLKEEGIARPVRLMAYGFDGVYEVDQASQAEMEMAA